MNDDTRFSQLAVAFSFLGNVYAFPSRAELLSALRDDRLFDDWVLPIQTDGGRKGLAMLREFAAGYDASGLLAVQRDFDGLFICSDRPVPILESAWVNCDGLLFQKTSLDVSRRYEANGFTFPRTCNEPADHFGFELLFVSSLSNDIHACMERSDAANARRIVTELGRFVDEHVLQWADAFLSEVLKRAGSTYYTGCSLLCSGAITTLRRFLGEGE